MAELLIDRVLADLDRVLERAWEEEDRIGYFAALYRRVTQKVKEGILTPGVFEDPARMDRLDFTFASRFLDALKTWQDSGQPTRSWQVALEASQSWRPVILQQLVLGINAHINLDLGIAAARVSPGPAIDSLHGDFQRINQILGSLIGIVEDQISEVSPGMGFLFRVAGEDGTRAVEFSMRIARDESWLFAKELAPLSVDEQVGPSGPIADRDRFTAKLGGKILHPGVLIDLVNLWVRMRESRDVRHVIEVLSRPVEPPVEHLVEPADPAMAHSAKAKAKAKSMMAS